MTDSSYKASLAKINGKKPTMVQGDIRDSAALAVAFSMWCAPLRKPAASQCLAGWGRDGPVKLQPVTPDLIWPWQSQNPKDYTGA